MKILLADDHTLFRETLVHYLQRVEPDMELLIAQDFYEVEEQLEKDSDFSLIILDLRMPGMKGLKGLENIRENYPSLRVAMMSGVAEIEDVNKAMELGAVGYFPKTLSGKALLQAIQLVLSGEKFLPINPKTNEVMESYYNDGEQKAGSAVNGSAVSKPDLPKVKLTPREKQVLGHLTNGSSNKEIARELGLQEVTVKLHVRGVCRKLSAKNRTQAALIAKEMGLDNNSSEH